MKPGLLVLALALPVSLAHATGGLGDFKLGMTPEQVKGVKACAPYRAVQATGGLECPNFVFDGKKRNISFIFDPAAGLKKIQLWFHEGPDRKAMETAAADLVGSLQKGYGELESNTLGAGAPVTTAALLGALDKMPATAVAKVQVKPKKTPADTFLFGTIARDPTHGYFVFLYFTVPPPAR